MTTNTPEMVNHPKHYNSHPSKVETIEAARFLPGSLFNVIKYLWRAGEKDPLTQDLKKVLWYIEDALKYDNFCLFVLPVSHVKQLITLDMVFEYFHEEEQDNLSLPNQALQAIYKELRSIIWTRSDNDKVQVRDLEKSLTYTKGLIRGFLHQPK